MSRAILVRVAMVALGLILIGAASPDVPAGEFQTWLASRKAPLDFSSDGVVVHVEALACPAGSLRDSCRWDGFNNQAAVTVRAPGLAPLTVETDDQSAYARIAVVRFDRRDARPGVIVESQYGGSSGDLTVQLLVPSGDGYRALPLGREDGLRLQGELANAPRDLSGDGRVDLQFRDGRFAFVFGCNACTPRPPRLFAVEDGVLVDESRNPALRGVFAADMARLAPICLSRARYRNGACAAYVADAARAGRFKEAWAAMLRHYDRTGPLWQRCDLPPSAWPRHLCPDGHRTRFRTFPQSLRAFLEQTRYLPASSHASSPRRPAGGGPGASITPRRT